MKTIKNSFILLGLIVLPLYGLTWQLTRTDKIEIPLTFIQGRPVIAVVINGKGPYKFVFDTGKMGDEIATDQGLVDQFNFKVVDSLLMGDPTKKNSIVLPVVNIPFITISNLKILNVKAAINPHAMPQINGVIGLSFFKDYLVTLDLGRHVLILEKGELGIADNRYVINYVNMMGIPDVKIKIGKQFIDAHLDCGNSRADVVVPESLAKRLTFISGVISTGKAKTMFNEVEMKQVKINEDLEIGPYKFPQPVINFPAFGNFVNLGNGFLKQFVITFDQKNKRLKLIKTTH
jgi:hypothetical protein